MKKDDGGPAFPQTHATLTSGRADGYGMSLRDYFAAKALPVVMSKADSQDVLDWKTWGKRVAAAAYDIADAMLEEREK